MSPERSLHEGADCDRTPPDVAGHGAIQPAEPISNRSDCYIEVWTQKNFEGEYLRIEGPVECSRLTLAKLDFGESITSLRVGPAAFVLAYGDEEFRGSMVSFGPGEEIHDLAELSFDDRIDSRKVINSLKVFDHSPNDTKETHVVAQSPSRSVKKRRGNRRRLAQNRTEHER
jgi:hypothetical protein